MKINLHTDSSNLGTIASQADADSFNKYLTKALEERFPEALVYTSNTLIGGPIFTLEGRDDDELRDEINDIAERVYQSSAFWTDDEETTT